MVLDTPPIAKPRKSNEQPRFLRDTSSAKRYAKKFVVIEEELGNVEFTQLQYELLMWIVTQGINDHISVDGKRNFGSTVSAIKEKIIAATGCRELKFTQMCCWFAYRNGLAKL